MPNAVMSNTIEFVSFKLKKGISIPNFLLVSEKFNEEFLSKQKGYISRNLLVDGKKWADYVLWETKEDVQNAMKIASQHASAREYLSCLNTFSCRSNFFSIEKEYN